MKNRSYVALLLGSSMLVGVTGIAGQAVAQTTTAPNGGSIETVVVTAEKRTESIKSVPMAITVIGQDELNKLNARNFDDIAALVPGMAVTESDPTHPDLILRGINAGGDGSTVGTYIDETPFGSSNALANAVDTSPNIDTYDMSRVEVLRGPQGTFYGAGAEGGLLKFVTNAPDPSGFADSFELGATDMDHSGAGGSARGMVNLPITDDLAVRAVGFYENTPGFINNVLTGNRNTNELTSEGGRLSVFYQPTSKITVRVSALMQQLNTNNADSEDVVLAANGSFSPKYGNYDEQRFYDEPEGVRYYLYNATINWDMDWATLTSSTSFGILHDHSLADATAFYGTDLLGYLDQGKFTQEVRLASEPGSGPLEWLAGVYYTNETSSLHQVLVGIGPLYLDSEYNEIAGFADLTYHVTPKLALSFGSRYSTNDQSSNEYGLEAGGGVSPASDSFTWSAAAHYDLDDQTSLYARVATGFRPGGPNVEPVGAPSTIPKTYAPDKLIDYELGAKSDLPDENLSFDADVFLINWTDIQLLTEVDGTGVNANGGTASSEGAEADVTWTPIDRLTFNMNGAFTDAYLTQNTNLLFVDGLKGNPLPWSSKWSGTLDGDYDFQSIGDWTPYVGAAWHYIGSRDSTFNGLAVQGAYGFSQSQYKIPSYDTLDLRVGVSWSKWSIELYAKNLNDAKGITAFSPYGTSAASNTPPQPVGAANVSLIEPRIVGIVLRGSF